jgi:IMP cyclohydrolase
VVAQRLDGGQAPAAALAGLCYEPDSPIFTPRITAVVDRSNARAWLGAARHPVGLREGADNTIVELAEMTPGDGVLLSTYVSDGNTVKTSRSHHDLSVKAADDVELLDELWSALDERFRVAAVTFSPLSGTIAPIRHA